MRERPAVEPSAVLADKVARRAELEELGCVNAIRRPPPGRIRAAEHEDVPLRVHGHGRYLTEVHSTGQLEEIRHRFHEDLGYGLRLCRRNGREQHGPARERAFSLFSPASHDRPVQSKRRVARMLTEPMGAPVPTAVGDYSLGPPPVATPVASPRRGAERAPADMAADPERLDRSQRADLPWHIEPVETLVAESSGHTDR